MPSILGLGGIFFKSKDPEKLKAWYQEHLGISGEYGVMFNWKEQAEKPYDAMTLFTPFKMENLAGLWIWRGIRLSCGNRQRINF